MRDKDGWTPLHAAAHWGVEEACRLLVEHLCDMDTLNNVVRGWGSREGTGSTGSQQPWRLRGYGKGSGGVGEAWK